MVAPRGGMHGCSQGQRVWLLPGGHAWLLPGGLGACMVAPGGMGACVVAPKGACMVKGACMMKGGMRGKGGHVWGRGACVVRGVCMVKGAYMAKGGMCCEGGCAWQRGGMRGMHGQSLRGRYASYWNAFLFFVGTSDASCRLLYFVAE